MKFQQLKLELIITLLFTSALYGQEFDLSRFIQNQHLEYPDTVVAGMAFDSLEAQLAKEQDLSMSWVGYAVKSSADEHFKVFQFIGEGCGAYCNVFYENVIAYLNYTEDAYRFDNSDQDLAYDIDSILHLNDNRQYLAFGTHSGRPRGVEGVWGKTVSHCEIYNEFKVLWELKATTSSLIALDSPLAEIQYDPQKHSITYTFDWYEEEEEFKPYRETGSWEFDGAQFKQVYEDREYRTH